jgi:heterodisulfide reductase subunit B
LVLQFIIKRDEPFSPNKLEELPATVKATTVKLTIEKTNSVLTALILSIEVKACIEGKL